MENKYTVVLIYPDYLAEDYPRDCYISYVNSENPRTAIKKAKQEAAKANKIKDKDDFLAIACFDGHSDMYFFEVMNP